MFSDIAWAAQEAGGQAAGQPGGIAAFFQSPIFMMLLIFGIFYFLLIRPQQKKAKEHKQMLEGLKKGDKVITSGGVYAVIEAVGTTTVTLKIAENVKAKFGKAYIAAVRPASEED
ncbi:MAG: preprotein translocase subunit YajC [Nitrospirota bacterium]|nr:preprotein translocase subunit YajC [Nitrospirota bacterium]